MDLLEKYLSQVRAAGQEPDEEILRFLEGADKTTVKESDRPPISFSSEYRLYNVLRRQPDASEARISAIIENLKVLEDTCRTPLTSLPSAVKASNALAELEPPYGRREDFLRLVFAPQLVWGLRAYFATTFTGRLFKQSSSLVEQSSSFFDDPTFMSFVNGADVADSIKDLRIRSDALNTLYNTIMSIHKLLPEENRSLGEIAIPEGFFTCSRDEFSATVSRLGKLVEPYESRAANKLLGLFVSINASAFGSHFFLFPEISILFKREKIRAAIKSSSSNVIASISQAFSSMMMDTRHRLGSLNANNHVEMAIKLSLIRQSRSIVNICSTNLLPFVEDLYDTCATGLAELSSSVQDSMEYLRGMEEETVRWARKLLSEYVKDVQECIILFAGAPANGFSTVQAPAHSILLLYMNKERQLVAQFPEKMIGIHDATMFLSSMGYDPQKLALPTEVTSCMQFVTYLTPYVVTLQSAAVFYNELPRIIRPYQKPTILKAAQVYEAEIQKAIQQSYLQPFQPMTYDITLAENAQDPANPVARFAKISEHIRKIHTRFKETLGKLDEFHYKCMEILTKISKLSLAYSQTRWTDALASLRTLIASFTANLSEEYSSTVIQYWTGCVTKLLATRYYRTLSPDLSLLKPLENPIGINQSTAALSMSPDNVKEYLLRQLMSVVDIPVNPSYHLSSDSALIKLMGDMRILSVDTLPKAMANVNKIALNLHQVETFLQKECALVLLAGEQNPKVCAEKLQTLENCKRLADLSQSHMAQTSPPEELLLANLSFLTPQPGSEKYVYIVSPSNGAITMNIEHAIRLLNKKPTAILEVAVAASSFFAEQYAEEISTECATFTKRCDLISGSFDSSDDFSKYKAFFQDAHTLVETRLKKIHAEMLEFRDVIMLSSNLHDSVITLIDTADASFQNLNSKLDNIESDMQDKKDEFKRVLAEKLAGANDKSIINRSRATLALIVTWFQEFIAYCNANVDVRLPAGVPECNRFFQTFFFVSGSGDNVVYNGKTAATYSTSFEEIRTEIAALCANLQKIASETWALFNMDYTQMLPNDKVELKDFVHVLESFQEVFGQSMPSLAEIERQCSKFMQSEWSIVKNRLDIIENIGNKVTLCKEQFTEEVDALYSSFSTKNTRGLDLTLDMIKELKQAAILYLTFIGSVCGNAAAIFKALRSSSLTQTHYRVIAEKIALMPIIKHFAKTDSGTSTSIVDTMSGCHVLFLTAESLFKNRSNIMSESPQTPEYKKILQIIRDICVRAENETSIRTAVEETSYWLTSEVKLSFTLHELTPLAQDELGDIGIGMDSKTGIKLIPLSTVWKHVFSQLVERKAIIAAVSSNPYSKSMKGPIDECNAIIDSYTRLGHVMITIAKQINVLEPVMGRRVLAAEHRKFYDCLRVLSGILLADCDEYASSACCGEGTQAATGPRSVTLALINIIKAALPYSVSSLQQYGGGTSLANTDNSLLGPYKGIVTTVELVSSLFSDIQTSLRKYLEQKRILFPRFYFLADSDVLEILSTGSYRPEETLRPHVKKLFSAIESLIFGEPTVQPGGQKQHIITGFVSSVGEQITLVTPVTVLPSMQPELWLNRFDTAHKETLRQQLLSALKIQGEHGMKPLKLLPINNLNFPEHSEDSTSQMALSETSSFDIITSYVLVQTTISPYVYSDNEFYNMKDLQPAIIEALSVGTLSGEVLCLAFAVMVTAQVDYALYQTKDAAASTQALKACKDRIEQYLSKFSAKLFDQKIALANYGSPEFLLGLKIKSLLIDIYQYINVLASLLAVSDTAANCMDARNWIWTRELKYRIHRDSDDLYIFALDSIVPYAYDYQGIPAKLIHTPLTSRCYNTISEAIALQLGGVLQGPAGTGKTESTKALGGKLGRTVVCFNCDTSIERSDLSRLLTGIILSGAMGCFDEINRLDSAVLSAVATDIEAIQKVILLRCGKLNPCAFSDCRNINLDNNTFTLSDITVPIKAISPYASIYVTMNPASREYRGRSELPFSLIKLLRGCYMGKADTSLIIETILSTSGFVHSKELAEKCDISYILCSRRIPKQVHLDWGLRSLQAILRQAAMMRATSVKSLAGSETNALLSVESNVIIKCISDATLSRITGQSVTIFKEIMKGVFGASAIEQSERSVKRFGAVSAIEEELINALPADIPQVHGVAVLQLYRALTAKMGVALLGNTGSGKTYVRSLLISAIAKVTKGNVLVQEFVIAPKSMSRQELLGYVDPTTGEWNDGALSSAARMCIQLLNSREIPCVWPIIVLDGSIDPIWIEALNSVLDDNRLLTMSSGERIRFPVNMSPLEVYFNSREADGSLARPVQMPVSFLFETDSLIHASPATISRLAIIVVPDTSVDDTLAYLSGAGANTDPSILEKLDLTGFRKFCKMGLPGAMKTSKAAINVCAHMFHSGVGTVLMAEPATDLQTAFVTGCMRSFYSELQICVAAGTTSEANDLTLSTAASTLAGRAIELQGTLATPRHGRTSADGQASAPHFDWVVAAIRSFLAADVPIIVTGPQTCGKHTAVLQALASDPYKRRPGPRYKFLTLSCSQLTTRQSVVDFLLSECIESQTADGRRLLRPRDRETKLLLALRDCDIVLPDEFAHVETFTFLWSLIAHKKFYTKGGACMHICDVQLAIITKSLDLVPHRLRRRMGIVYMKRVDRDVERMCGPELFKIYSALAKSSATIQSWQRKMVSEAETARLTNTMMNIREAIALPEFLKAVGSLSLFAISLIKRVLADDSTQMNSDKLAKLVEIFLEVPIPYSQGKLAARNCLKSVVAVSDDTVLTYAQLGVTAQTVQRAVQSDEGVPASYFENMCLDIVTNKMRLAMVKELVNSFSDIYNGLRLYYMYLYFMTLSPPLVDTVVHEYFKLLSAIEVALVSSAGLVLLSQPHNFSVETALVGALSVGYTVLFAGADHVTPFVLRMLADKVSRGHHRIAYFLDCNTLETDSEWYALLSAISSRDILYFRNKLSIADLRSFIATFIECTSVSNSDSMSESELILLFLHKFVDAIRMVIILNPERRTTDTIFSLVPALRRNIQLVSFELLYLDSSSIQLSMADNIIEAPIKTISYTLPMKTVSIVSGALTASNDGKNIKPLGTIEQILKIASGYVSKYITTYKPHSPLQLSCYTKIYILYHLFKSKWTFMLNKNRERLSNGLKQLQKAQAEVDALGQQAQQRSKKVESSQEEANMALENISKRMTEANDRKLAAHTLQKELSEKEQGIMKDKEQADAELSTVMPILNEATKAVQAIPSDALTEIKSFQSPPPAVSVVLEAVLVMLGHQDLSWKGMKAFLSQSGVLKTIANFDMKTASRASLNAVNKVVKNNAECFEQERIRRVSRAAAPLAKWIQANLKYAEVYNKMEPLIKAVDNANRSLDSMRKEIQAINDDVAAIEAQISDLREDFNAKTEQLVKYKQELQQIQAKQAKGQEMLHGLRTEKKRWEESYKLATQQLDTIDKCAVNAAILFVIAGTSTDDTREKFFDASISAKDGSNSMTVRAAFDALLYDSLAVNRYVSYGLVPSTSSLENTAVFDMLYSSSGVRPTRPGGPKEDDAKDLRDMRNYTLMTTIVLTHVTEATGVLAFLKSYFDQSKNQDIIVEGTTFVSATSENLSNLVSIAARFGKTIVVMNCDSGAIPSALLPYIRYSGGAYRTSENAANAETLAGTGYVNTSYIHPASTTLVPVQSYKYSEVSPSFRMIITSAVDIFIPSDLTQNVLILSYAPTRKSQANLYIDRILAEWSPESLKKIEELRDTQLNFSEQLYSIEQNLLTALTNATSSASSTSSIIEDAALIDVLKQAEQQSLEIQKAREGVEVIQRELDSIKERIMPIAQDVDTCVTTFASLQSANHLYVSDQSSVLPLLLLCLRAHKPSSSTLAGITPELVAATRQHFYSETLLRIQAAVFSDDVVAASALLLRNYMPNVFTDGLFNYFTGRSDVANNASMPTWVPEQLTQEFKHVLTCFTPSQLSAISFNNGSIWSAFPAKIKVCNDVSNMRALFPEQAGSLTYVEMAALISACRKDLAANALQLAVGKMLFSNDYTSSLQFSDGLMAGVHHSSGLLQPIILYSLQGQDPTNAIPESTPLVISSGQEHLVNKNLEALLDTLGSKYAAWKASLAPDSEEKAVMHTIVIKGAHLCCNWLSTLPNMLIELSIKYAIKYEEDLFSRLRLVLLLEPKPYIPCNLSRIAWRICLTAESSPAEALLDAIRKWPKSIPAQKNREKFVRKLYALLYISTAMHTILDARRLYAPRGVALDPGWTQNDLMATISIMQNCMTRPLLATKTENEFLLGFAERLRGLLLDAIYGVATKDPSDNALLTEFASICYDPRTIAVIFSLIDKGKIDAPEKLSVEQNMKSYSVLEIVTASTSVPFLRYLLPPIHILCNQKLTEDGNSYSASHMIDEILQYVQCCYPEKPTPDYLGLPNNALLTKSLKSSLMAKSILARISMQSGVAHADAGQGTVSSIYDTVIKLAAAYEKDTKQKLTEFAVKLQEIDQFLSEANRAKAAVARIISIVEELHLQGKAILAIKKVLESDFEEADKASTNYLLASARIKAIASLILSRVLPEQWCVGITAVPCPTAPHDAPELATVRSGNPFDYIAFLASAATSITSAYHACRQSTEDASPAVNIELSISNMPRPAAFVEAVRRYEGLAMNKELNKVHLVATTQPYTRGAHPIIVLSEGSCIVQGCSMRAFIDLNVESEQLSRVYVYAADDDKHTAATAVVPFYIDQLRESHMAGIEMIHLKVSSHSKEGDKLITLSGIYVHLANR